MNDNQKPGSLARIVLKLIRMGYADQAFTPKAFEAGQPERYGLTCIMPPGHPGIELIEDGLLEIAGARWGARKNWPNPLKGLQRDPVIKLCEEYPKLGIEAKGWVFVRANSQERPTIVGPRLDAINPADLRAEVYSGRWATVSVNPFAYERQTGSGVSLGLGNIQLLKHDERLGAYRPKPEDEFEPEDIDEPDNDNNNLDDVEVLTPRRPTRRR